MSRLVSVVVVGLAAMSMACSESVEPTPTPIPAPKPAVPDLAAKNVEGPAIVAPGRKMTVRYEYHNIGDTIAGGNAAHRIYLSRDGTRSDADILLGPVPSEPLGVGAVSKGEVTFTIPTSIIEGQYWLMLHLDETRLIADKSESNNILRASHPTKIAHGSDMEVLSISMSSDANDPYYPGVLRINVNAHVVDTGTRPSTSGFGYTAYVSRKDVFDNEAIPIMGGCCHRLGINQWLGTTYLYDHKRVAPGEYYSWIVVEHPDSSVVELNPDNNIRRGNRFVVPRVYD